MIITFKHTKWLIYSLICLASIVNATAVKFTNCIPQANNNQSQSSFFADNVDAVFDTKTQILRFNVSGTASGSPLVDLSSQTNKYTTLRVKTNDIQNTLFDQYLRFCDVAQGDCPIMPGPASFIFQAAINSTEQLSTLETTFMILSAEEEAVIIGCVNVETTEVLKHNIVYVVIFGSFLIFVLLGLLFLFSAVTRPWPSTVGFYVWSIKYNSDINHIRVSTPSFTQYLFYLQFLFFLSCMNLDYPGFYQPMLACFAWSALLFPLNFVNKNGSWSDVIEDNVYPSTVSDPGLASATLFARVLHPSDVWTGAIIWLLVLVAGSLLCWHIGYLGYRLWFRRHATDKRFGMEEFYNFLSGMVVRIVFIYFAFPILTFTFFQLYITNRDESPVVSSAMAGVFLGIWIVSVVFMSKRILTTQPASELFDNEQLLSRFGALYNFYCQDGIIFFAFEFIFLLLRSMAIGAIQMSGVAQISILATVEIAYIITVFVIRPYNTKANMNIYLILVSLVRFISVMLSITFVPSMGTHFETKLWIGYIIISLNLVTILGYFLCPALYHITELGLLYRRNCHSNINPTQVYGPSKLARRKYEEISKNATQSQSALLTKEYSSSTNMSAKNHLVPNVSKPSQAKMNLTINTNFSNAGFATLSPCLSTPDTPAEALLLTPSSFTMNKNMNSAHNGFYRPPRRRTSYDRASPGYYPSQSPIYKSADEKYLIINNDNYNEDFDFCNDEKKKRHSEKKKKAEAKDPLGRVNVDYAIRESDLYYKPAGLFDDDVIENNSKLSEMDGGGKKSSDITISDMNPGTPSMSMDERFSNQPLRNNSSEIYGRSSKLSTDYDMYKPPTSADILTDHALDKSQGHQKAKKQGFFTSIQGWVSHNMRLPASSRNTEVNDDDLAPRGFEVLHRGPIRTTAINEGMYRKPTNDSNI